MKAQTKQTYRIFWQHVRKYRGQVFLMAFGMIGAVGVGTYIPLLYKDFFDVLAAGNTADPRLVRILMMIFLFAGIEWAFWRVTTFFNNFMQPRVMADLLVTCFKYLHKHSFNFFNNNFVGSLVRKASRYERAFEDISDIIYWEAGNTVLRIGLILGVVYFRSPILAVIILAWCLTYAAVNFAFSKYKLKYDIQRAEADTRVTGHLADTVTNNINLKLFSGFQKETKVFTKLTDDLFRIRRFSWDLAAINEAFQSAMLIILEILMYYVAIRLWRQGILTIGDFALIQVYIIQIFGRLWNLGKHIRQLYERLADADEMTEILMMPHEISDAPYASELKVLNGGIEFSNILFGYNPAKPIFEKFNLKISSGERVALIGPSGGGKTTIVKLLFRFFDVQDGEIKIDGQNVAKVTQDSLHENLSLVPQEPILFHRSLYENIAYAKPGAEPEKVFRAAKLAHCHEFITGFEHGYDTFVGDRGIKLSGGERQRVAIARAILKNSPILVLDEATSSLDSESEHLIQDALKNLMKNRTTIVIAHRLSTIMQMDRIVVLENGKITEEGKHAELLKVQQGTYQKLWDIQAGGFAPSK